MRFFFGKDFTSARNSVFEHTFNHLHKICWAVLFNKQLPQLIQGFARRFFIILFGWACQDNEVGVTSWNSRAAVLDSWTNFNMLLTGYVFNSPGPIKSWTFDSRGTQGTTLQVYRGKGSTWTLVGQNVINTNVNSRFTYHVPFISLLSCMTEKSFKLKIFPKNP